jgi:hypothetical protein
MRTSAAVMDSVSGFSNCTTTDPSSHTTHMPPFVIMAQWRFPKPPRRVVVQFEIQPSRALDRWHTATMTAKRLIQYVAMDENNLLTQIDT